MQNIREVFDKYITLEKELKDLEQQIFDLESFYLEDTSLTGNILKGWDQYIIRKGTNYQSPAHPIKKPRITANEMIFSLSSITSPAYQCIEEIAEKSIGEDILNSNNKRKKEGGPKQKKKK